MIRNWIGQHTGALIFAAVFGLFSLIRFLPARECCFIEQRMIQAAMVYFHGFANFINIFTFFLPTPLNVMVSFSGMFVYGMAYGLVIESLWKWRRWLGKLLIPVLLVINALPGSFIVTMSDTLIGPPYATCTKELSDTIAVRIVAYPEKGFIPGAYFFFSTTKDGGKTWRQFMVFRHDDQVDPPCENIRSTSSNHLWAWMGWQTAVTVDEGKSWEIWKPRESWPDWICCNYGLIENVTFQDTRYGHMVLDTIPGRGETPFLYTQDGGKTWK